MSERQQPVAAAQALAHALAQVPMFAALERLGQRNPAAMAAAGESRGAPALVDDRRPTPAASAVLACGPLPRRRLAGFGLALLPLSLWTMAPPDGRGAAGWQALLTVAAAAIPFATEVLAEEAIALSMPVWRLMGLVGA